MKKSKKKNFKEVGTAYMGHMLTKGISYEMSDELSRRLKERQESYECFWAFIIKKYGYARKLYDGILGSESLWEEYINDRKTKETRIRVHTGLELESFMTEMSVQQNPDKIFGGDVMECGPLVMYLMGCYLGFEKEVEKFKGPAIKQMLEEPHYFDTYTKLKDFYPIRKEDMYYD